MLNTNVITKCGIKLSIHAEQSAEELKQQGQLKTNVPVVKEIAIVMPDSDLLTKNDHW